MSNFKNVTISISGLETNSSYYYAFKGVGGNWPAVISVSSGVLAADSPTQAYDINTSVQFCSTTGSCYGNSNLLPYSLDESRQDKEEVFAVLDFILKDTTTSEVVLTKNVRVMCSGCISKPSITAAYDNYLSTTNSATISLNISNLVIGQKYNYRFYGLDGNWPVMLSNISGTIIPNRSDNNVLISKLTFNEATGLYTGDNNLLISPLNCVPSKDLYAVVYAELIPVSSPAEVSSSESIFISCADCLPSPDISNISNATISSTNKHSLSISINNLKKNNEYNYQFHSAGGNWPVNVNKVSGTFIANDTSFLLNSKIAFCDSTGICSSSSNSILNTNINCLDRNDQYLTAYLYVQPVGCSYQSCVSNHFNITCSDCLQKPTVTLAPNASTTSQDYNLSMTFNNLVIGQTYNYSFNGTYSNWPVVLDPASGTVVANSSSETVINKAVFCFPTGDASGQAGLLPYSINNVNQDYEYKFTKFRVNLSNSLCSDINASSREFTLTCLDCLPCLNCSTISFSGGPMLALPTGCCSGTDMMFVSVTGANPDNAYRYELASLSGDISFVPRTGLVYVKNDGSSVIPVLMSTNLVNREQALAQAKLIDIATGGESIDFLGLICGSGCSIDSPNV
jgi:hypothetical protein